uniref:Uncharacterized protein n=1 Tax=Candidatus Kentrum sp. DK TaxID=2126562 RepID=A0A450SSR2_9GAMM|nr:MAG: hypothetical protein BECKDK2373B_GA0170837_10633 [Candidatus Kentron sp. DK]
MAPVTYRFLELYAKVASRPLTALKTSSKCSFIPYKLRFLVSFRLVMKHVRLLHEALLDTGFPAFPLFRIHTHTHTHTLSLSLSLSLSLCFFSWR